MKVVFYDPLTKLPLGNAQQLLQQLRKGASFPALARQFSEAASAARGGDLGWIQEGQLLEELDAALAQMRLGTLSPSIFILLFIFGVSSPLFSICKNFIGLLLFNS